MILSLPSGPPTRCFAPPAEHPYGGHMADLEAFALANQACNAPLWRRSAGRLSMNGFDNLADRSGNRFCQGALFRQEWLARLDPLTPTNTLWWCLYGDAFSGSSFNGRRWLATFQHSPEVLESAWPFRRFLSELCGAVATSPAQHDFLAHYLPSERLAIVPAPVNLEVFKPRKPIGQRRGLVLGGWDQTDINLLRLLLDVCAKRWPDLPLTLFGPQERLPDKQLGTTARLPDPGPAARAALFGETRCVLLAQRRGILGPLVWEALAAGAFVVAFDIDGALAEDDLPGLQRSKPHLNIEKSLQRLMERVENVIDDPTDSAEEMERRRTAVASRAGLPVVTTAYRACLERWI